MLRILLVLSEAPPVKSGIARVAAHLQAGLRERGHRVDVLSLSDVPRWERGEVRLSSMALKLPGLRARLRSYDVINIHGVVPTMSDVALLYARTRLGRDRPRIVYTHHAPVLLKNPFLYVFTTLYNVLHERLARLADHVLVSSPSYKQQLSRHVPAQRITVVPWGVDVAFSQPKPSSTAPFTVLFVGQIRPYKGLPVLLNAAQDLKQTRLWIVGEGHKRADSEALASRLGLSDIHFFGSVSDNELRELYRSADAVVLPSVTRSEAFGIVLLEGMAAGCIPVASHLPGVADVVGAEGYTFPAGDAAALRATLRHLRDDRTLRHRMASLARAKAELYTWERVAFGYETVFQQVSKAHQPDAPLPASSPLKQPGPEASPVRADLRDVTRGTD